MYGIIFLGIFFSISLDVPILIPITQGELSRNILYNVFIIYLFHSGIYLACILYHEDKLLVTNEDFIPVIEIDETYPSYLHTDYHWLMKVRIEFSIISFQIKIIYVK